MSQFELKLAHVPGSQMVQSNALSRRSDLYPDDETNNMDITLLPDSLFVQTIDTEMHNLIATNLMKDDIVKDAIEALKSNGTPPHSLIGKSTMDYYSSKTGVTSLIHQAYENELWNVITILSLLDIPVNSKPLKK